MEFSTGETTLALENYRRACDVGRGAVFFAVVRGKVADHVAFPLHYGRAVLFLGLPFRSPADAVLRARLDFLLHKFQIREADFLAFDAMRQTAAVLANLHRGKTDYSVVLLADARFARHDKRAKLPKWLSPFLHDAHLNLSTDSALAVVQRFLKQMAQPLDEDDRNNAVFDANQVQAALAQAQAQARPDHKVPPNPDPAGAHLGPNPDPARPAADLQPKPEPTPMELSS